MGSYRLDPSEILSPAEIAAVLADGERRARRSRTKWQTVVVFRLATCCGLRADEIAGLRLADLHLASEQPYIRVPARVAKRRKGHPGARGRVVPLTIDQANLAALRAWKSHRIDSQGARASDPVVCVQVDQPIKGGLAAGVDRSQVGRPLTRQLVYRRFKTALKPLPKERQKQLHPHSGRHTFGSYVAHHFGLAAARDWLGHASIATTNVYTHTMPDQAFPNGNVFSSATPPPPPAAE